MVGIQTLGFLSVASELFFSTGAITCISNSFLTSARITSRISPFNWNGCRQWNRSSSCASGEVVTPVEIGKATSSADLFARLSLVLKKLSLPRTYCASLDIGCKPVHQSPIAYNKLMKAFTQVGNLDEVLRLAQEMKESNCNPNVYCYNTVLNALVEANQPTLAEALFKEMLADDVAPDVASYNILVKLYSFYLKDFDSVYKVIAMMTENGFHPDLTTYCTLITGLCRAEKLKEARDYLCLLLVEKIHVDAYIYTPIVQSYCSIGKIEDAKQLMNDMERLGYMPSCVTYNILIRALCKIGSFDEVESVLIESSSKGWKPDAITFNTYMDGLCKYGRAKEAYEKLDIMLINGICPGTVTLNILLDCLCHELRFSEAIFLLGQSFELGWYPGIVGYNTVMCRLSRSGKCLIVLKLFVDLLKNGISHNTKTLNIVIDSLCNAGNVQQAKCFIDNRGFVANVTTYNTMVHCLFQMDFIHSFGRLCYQ